MAGAKVYSFQEVGKHNDRKDCWLIIAGKVYDVTPFMEEHPGGDEVLLACTGKDATADYVDIGHSESAKELMAQYCIGELDAATVPAKLTYTYPSDASLEKPSTGSGAWATTLLQVAAPLLLLALALGVQTYGKVKAE